MSFDVLSRHCDIHHHYLIEASAGTGKTYSIENVVARLLIEAAPGQQEPLRLEQILVVTFTRRAARDLKRRIRNNLEQLKNGAFAPDYWMAIVERGEEAVRSALRAVEAALFAFDRAQIFTIHGFCSRLLRDFAFESRLAPRRAVEEEGMAERRARVAITDFLRSEMRPKKWSPAQLEIAMRQDFEKLREKLLKAMSKTIKAEPLPSFEAGVAHFQQIMATLKFDSRQLLEHFREQAPLFKGLCDQRRQIKPEGWQKAERFAALFDKSCWTADDFEQLLHDDFFWIKALAPLQRKAGKALPNANLQETLAKAFAPLLAYSDSKRLFETLAMECQCYLRRVEEEEELLGFEGLLRKVHQLVQDPQFVTKVRARYSVALIDEFQDTDPLQWEIFRELFLDQRLYLVGDPKQSIYAFRQADIYTYLKAAETLGEQHQVVLETNYRSQPALVKALNTLFSQASDWISLPRLQQTLPYRPVQAGNLKPLASGEAIHFWLVDRPSLPASEIDRQFFFPFIVDEIERLRRDEGLDYAAWAILVRDRYQERNLAHYLKEQGVPFVQQRQAYLAHSPALPALRELVEALLHPNRESLVKRAFGGPLIGWTHDQLKIEEELPLATLFHLRETLIGGGVERFFPALMNSTFHADGATVAERLLQREEGVEGYEELCQIVEWVLTHHPFDPLLKALKALAGETEGDESPKRMQNRERQGVQILTLHTSKGLEFEAVFPVGLWVEKKNDEEAETAEGEAEKMRLLYVALTRAKERLYLPAYFSDKGAMASPMRLFLRHLQIETASSLCHFLNGREGFSYTLLEKRERAEYRRATEQVPLQFVRKTFCKPKPAFLSSYTSLLHRIKEPFFPPSVALSNANEEKSVHTLPAGSQVGTLLHTILESLSLETVGRVASAEELLPLVQPHLQGGGWADWGKVIAQMVYNAFHVPLPLASGSTSLVATDPSSHYRETEFLFPWEETFAPEGATRLPGFLKGVIDLLFQHEGKYYLLDWKSNRLGPSGQDYGCEQMEKAMREGGYFLQASLYTEALRRYLRLVSPGPFEPQFGGILYLFLRGLDLQASDNPGVYRLWKV